MIRVRCTEPESSFRSCVAALLELHPRDLLEGDHAIERVLADRGLFTTTVRVPKLTETVRREAFRAYGFWILTGPFGACVMLGPDVYFTPCQPPDFEAEGEWRCTVLVPYNPRMVRNHGKPGPLP